MARPRAYERHKVVDAAKTVFWERGYEGTALDGLEDATGLSRSSIYQAFGTKRGLFDAALEEYTKSFVDPRLAPVEARGAGLPEAAAFFSGLATLFDDPQSRRGCLMINATAEMAAVDPVMEALGAQFVNRYRTAFLNATRGAEAEGAMSSPEAPNRAEVLTAAAVGLWLAVRVDHSAAAASCRAIATEILSWGDSTTTKRRKTRRGPVAKSV